MVIYNVIVSEKTFQLLEKHIIFLAKVNSKSAHNLRKTFIRTIKSLHNNPDRYPLWLPNTKLSKPYHKLLIKKRYLLIFYIDENNVYIDSLLDCRMDGNEILESSKFN